MIIFICICSRIYEETLEEYKETTGIRVEAEGGRTYPWEQDLSMYAFKYCLTTYLLN